MGFDVANSGIDITYNEKVNSVHIKMRNIDLDFQLRDLVICSHCKTEYDNYHYTKSIKPIMYSNECCNKSDKIYVISNYYPFHEGYGTADKFSYRILSNKWKYVDSRDLITAVIDWYLSKFARELLKSDILIPVPGTKNDPNKKFYPQMDYIIKFLSSKYDIPYVLDSLSKEHDKDCVINKKSPIILNKNVLLIDDVYTRGRTYNSCSNLLKELGAISVNSLVVGKTV